MSRTFELTLLLLLTVVLLTLFAVIACAALVAFENSSLDSARVFWLARAAVCISVTFLMPRLLAKSNDLDWSKSSRYIDAFDFISSTALS